MAKKVLYVGEFFGTSKHRFHAMERLGLDAQICDPTSTFRSNRILYQILLRAPRLASRFVGRKILARAKKFMPDAIIVNQGAAINKSTVQALTAICPVAVYVNDDPFGGRDGNRFDCLIDSLPFYSLVAVVRDQNVDEAKRSGAKRVLRAFMAADEIAHDCERYGTTLNSKSNIDVAFVGTWMPERGAFFAELASHGVEASIWGLHWHKAPEWPAIKHLWKGPGNYSDRGYAELIHGAKICIGLLSKGNRDGYTTRSIEVPMLGGLFCAERTDDHLSMYTDGEEAVFFNSVEECAHLCLELLDDADRRLRIAFAGRRRALASGMLNERLMQLLITSLD